MRGTVALRGTFGSGVIPGSGFEAEFGGHSRAWTSTRSQPPGSIDDAPNTAAMSAARSSVSSTRSRASQIRFRRIRFKTRREVNAVSRTAACSGVSCVSVSSISRRVPVRRTSTNRKWSSAFRAPYTCRLDRIPSVELEFPGRIKDMIPLATNKSRESTRTAFVDANARSLPQLGLGIRSAKHTSSPVALTVPSGAACPSCARGADPAATSAAPTWGS
jgi:hypothetical protein